MSVDFETEMKYNQVVGTIMQNVMSEAKIAHKIVLWDFNEEQPMNKLYFNVAALVADMYHQYIYVQMPLISYLKMKWKRRKTRRNLRWCSPWMARELPTESKTSVYVLMDFVREYYDVTEDYMDDINSEFYGWV